MVPYDSKTINELLDTSATEDVTFEAWLASLDYEMILHMLCYLGSTLKTHTLSLVRSI